MGMFWYQEKNDTVLFESRFAVEDGDFIKGEVKRAKSWLECPLGGVFNVTMTEHEFIFSSTFPTYKNLYGEQKLCLSHDRIISFEIVVSRQHASVGQLMRGRPHNEIEIEYMGIDDKYCQVRFAMRKFALGPNRNQAECEKLVRLMKAEGIFDKFIKPEPSPQSAPAHTQPQPDVLAKVQQLADLHRQGILTDEEFEAKKTELLARL